VKQQAQEKGSELLDTAEPSQARSKNVAHGERNSKKGRHFFAQEMK